MGALSHEYLEYSTSNWFRLTHSESETPHASQINAPEGVYVYRDHSDDTDPTFANGYSVVVGRCDIEGKPLVEHVYTPHNPRQISDYEEPLLLNGGYKLSSQRDYSWERDVLLNPFTGQKQEVDVSILRVWNLRKNGARHGRESLTALCGTLEECRGAYMPRIFVAGTIVGESIYSPSRSGKVSVGKPQEWIESWRNFFDKSSLETLCYKVNPVGNMEISDVRSRNTALRLGADLNIGESRKLQF